MGQKKPISGTILFAVGSYSIALLLGLFPAFVRGQTEAEIPEWVVYPEEEWIKISPAEAGFDAVQFNVKILLNVLAQPRPAAFAGVVPDPEKWGAVLTRGGYLVHSWGDPEYKYQSASLGKDFTYALVGFAVEEGLIELDDLVSDTWTGEGLLSHPHKYLDRGFHRTLTWRHLLDHQGGFVLENAYHWRRRRGGFAFPTGGSDYYVPIPEWAKWTGDPVFDNYAHAEPGQYRHYSSGGYWRLGQALTALWDRDLKELIDAKLFRHMGIPADRWDWIPGKVLSERKDFYPAIPGYGEYCDPPYKVNGHVVRGAPGWVVMSSSDLARFGLLIATKGIWKGKRLLGREFLPGRGYGVGIHQSKGDPETYIAIGKINTDKLSSLQEFNEFVLGPVKGPTKP